MISPPTIQDALARILALLQASQYLSNIASSLISIVAVFLLYRSVSNEYFAAVDQGNKRSNDLTFHIGSTVIPPSHPPDQSQLFTLSTLRVRFSFR
jgi:ABC-type nickel/cobalt efflux system permease component RcnA